MPGLDAVIVATPNTVHEEGVVAAAKHGKHVLCEKPLAVDVAAARRMVKACDDAKVVLQVGFNQRFWGQVRNRQAVDRRGVHRQGSSDALDLFREVDRLSRDARAIATTSSSPAARRSSTSRFTASTSLATCVGDFSGVFGELAHSELPEIVDDNVLLLDPVRRAARAECSPAIAIRRISATAPIFTGPRAPSTSRAKRSTPFASAPLAVYTEKSAADLPGRAAGSALSRGVVEEFRGRLDHGQATA